MSRRSGFMMMLHLWMLVAIPRASAFPENIRHG